MRYILLVIAIMGGLLSFYSYAAVINQCSSSAPPVYGSYTYFLSGGSMHIDLDGCDYLSHDNLVIVYEDTSSGVPISHEGNWYPTGKKSNEVVHDKPFTTNLSQQTDQMNRYCAQAGKCDSKGFPVNTSDWLKFKEKDDAAHENPSEKPGEKPADSDNLGSGSSGDSSTSPIFDTNLDTNPGGSSSDGYTGEAAGSTDDLKDGSQSGSSTTSPSTPESEKPYPDNASPYQLLDSFYACRRELFLFPDGKENHPAYNAKVNVCNGILYQLQNSLREGDANSSSDENHVFLTENSYGEVFSCKRNVAEGGVWGYIIRPLEERDGSLNMPYYPPDGADSYCQSVYNRVSSPPDFSYSSDSDGVSSDSSGSLSDKPLSCPAGYQPSVSNFGMCTKSGLKCPPGYSQKPDSDPGICINDSSPDNIYAPMGTLTKPSDDVSPVLSNDGRSSSGDDGNGDIVAAINAFHADANKHHEETMNALDFPASSADSIKGSLSSDINALYDSMKKELADSYNDAMAELKGVFGDIDSYVPDIKLSFDLPTQFTAGIMGRCVPLVFDFNISLVGLPSYHLHAEGVQACKLYDLYVRSIVEYMLYFMTALACRRVFTRAAEFITSQP